MDVPANDVLQGGGLDSFDYFGWIGSFVPEPVPVPDTPEGMGSHNGAEHSEKPSMVGLLTDDAHPQVQQVGGAVQPLEFPGQLVLALREELVELVHWLESEGLSSPVVAGQPVIPTPLDVQAVQVQGDVGLEVLPQEVPEFVHHLLVPFLHDCLPRPPQDVCHHPTIQLVGIEEQVLQAELP